MKFKLDFLFPCLGALILASCTSAEHAGLDPKSGAPAIPQTQDGGPKADESTKAEVRAPSKEIAKSNSLNVLDYFYLLYPKGSGRPVLDLNFSIKDIENGYLQVDGRIEGYMAFALFRGESSDWLIEEQTGCGPECEQASLMAYKLESGKVQEKLKLADLYPRKAVGSFVDKQTKALARRYPNEKEIKPWFKLPKAGTSIEILLLVGSRQVPGAGAYRIGALNWNKKSFDFVPETRKKLTELEFNEISYRSDRKRPWQPR
jgi:hypothetical protein